MEDTNSLYLNALLKAVEETAGRRMITARDFSVLSEKIADELHQPLSVNTLKRLWGWLENDVRPRESTLDLLAQYVGHADWQAFVAQLGGSEGTDGSADAENPEIPPPLPELPSEPDTEGEPRRSWWLPAVVVALLALLVFSVGYTVYTRLQQRNTGAEEDSLYIIRMGDRFPTYEAYLARLGINSPDPELAIWSQIMPGLSHSIVGGFEYHHPHWGNEGNPDSLMPTITERWAPADADEEVIAIRNTDHYYTVRRTNEFYIVFMKNLPTDSATVDSAFVFCGVYRMRLSESDTTRVVWERVAEQLDLLHLDYLERFRN